MTLARPPSDPPTCLTVGDVWLRIEDVVAQARAALPVRLSADPAWQAGIQRNHETFARHLAVKQAVYGVTTGFGHSCTVPVEPASMGELPYQLIRFHGCGLGRPFDAEETRAILLTRLCSLARGYSGVRLELLEHLAALLNHDILPVIPSEGSVGASGDLTPLSYVAAALIGEREVVHQGEVLPAAEALRRVGRLPLALQPKDSLALMNGTAVMTALACLAFSRAEGLLRLAARITALAVVALEGNRSHFDPALFRAKPHPGQARVAAWIHADLDQPGSPADIGHLQDRYSIRCAPHVLGVLADALTWQREWIEIELNSANDNPIVDTDSGAVFHGGHFYGGHIAFAMDALKAAVAGVADLLDRQIALLVDPSANEGLPANLSGATAGRRALNHGLKAVQIGASAWTAEALKLTMPAASFSRSTECHNQDKVSMGTIAARDALRVLELTEQVAAAALVASAQGVHLRRRLKPAAPPLAGELADLMDRTASVCPFLEEDRRLDGTLATLCAHIRGRTWSP